MSRRKWILVGMTFCGIIVIVCLTIMYSYLRPITPRDIRELSRQLALNLSGKHSLVEVVLIVANQVKHPRIKRTLMEIHHRLKTPHQRKQFDELLADYPEVFPHEFVLAVDYGGMLGKADIVLKELSETWPDKAEERKEVITKILKPLALQALKDKDQFRRGYALYVLAKLGCKDAVPDILPLLQDPNPNIRWQARKALQLLGYKVSK